MIEHARTESQNHRFTYEEAIPVESITQSICDLALNFGEDGSRKAMSRPFGVALLVAGMDNLSEKGPKLFHTDPSGTFLEYKAKAIGAGSEGAQSNLQEHYRDDMSFTHAETLALSTLKQVMEEKINSNNVEMAAVKNGLFRIYSNDELEEVIQRL
ncbi:proteasome subunit alpha type-5 [Anaeramoeba ignava]|uniref:Proteasome subunit alpha type-5 n=1 Tax=Anaeramoeba ignava TaxID=1746090 RepID=A0A9Q0LEV8_ANAIG|nr:proteasome subunit alpha type-5 [Anaeramoeba ignava]